MVARRLHIRLDEARARRLEREVARRGVAVAVLVREAIDAAFPAPTDDRRAAGDRILAAVPMPVPDIAELHAELADAHDRRP